MRIVETKVYTIDEHPNKDKCFEWIRDNWHDLNEHGVDEFIDSLEALHNEIGGTLNYSISAVPDRGEDITFCDYDEDALHELDAHMCPLTGVIWDAYIIKTMQEGLDASDALSYLHDDTEHIYSDEGLTEACLSNGYEFNEDGECV